MQRVGGVRLHVRLGLVHGLVESLPLTFFASAQPHMRSAVRFYALLERHGTSGNSHGRVQGAPNAI